MDGFDIDYEAERGHLLGCPLKYQEKIMQQKANERVQRARGIHI